jgi:hypothetical protein
VRENSIPPSLAGIPPFFQYFRQKLIYSAKHAIIPPNMQSFRQTCNHSAKLAIIPPNLPIIPLNKKTRPTNGSGLMTPR